MEKEEIQSEQEQPEAEKKAEEIMNQAALLNDTTGYW